MAKKWLVTTEDLRGSSKLIKEQTEKYHSAWNNLYSELDSMRSDAWSGMASDQFNTQLEGFRNDFQELENVLVSYSNFLLKAAENYEKTEEEIKRVASKLNTGY